MNLSEARSRAVGGGGRGSSRHGSPTQPAVTAAPRPSLFDESPTEVPWFQRSAGEVARDKGMARVDRTEDEAGDWRDRALAHIESLDLGVRLTSETVRAAVGDPVRPNAFGSLMRTAALQGLIRHVGWVKATRGGMHATDLRQWERA